MTNRTYTAECYQPGRGNVVALFTATQNANGTWYATATGFGCSKDYRSSVEAVQALLDAECCRQINMWVGERS
jgi:hypothetical protein